jgi:cytochrome P450
LGLLIVAILYPDWKMKRDLPIPGPFILPIIGTMHIALWTRFKGTFHEITVDHYAQYGKTFRARIGGKDLILTADLENVKYFLQTNFTNYQKSNILKEVMTDMLGQGIFNNDGEAWKEQRQTASSLFHFNNLQAFVEVFKERANVMSEVIAKKLESGPIDMQDIFMRYTMDSIGELGFGVNISSLTGNEKAMKFSHGFDYVQEASLMRFLFHPFWKYFSNKKFYEKLSAVDDFMKGVIDDRRKEIKAGVDISNRVDLLSKFITEKSDDGSPKFGDQYLLDVLKNFLIAGRDTTAISLSWAIYMISQHPNVEERLLNEINAVTRKDGGITYENQAELKYMRHVIDETLRLYPPVPRDSRMAVRDDVLPSGHPIPAGTVITYTAFSQHRLPEYFKDPLTFNPDRWETDNIKPWSFIPFHGGPRICLGQNMAYQEIKVALAVLLPIYKFRLVEGERVTYKLTITLPTNGLKMWVEKRKN